MKFYTKIPKHSSSVSYTSSLTGEYQEYLKHGFIYDKLPAYKPKRKTMFQALSSIAGLKATRNPGYFSPVVHNNIAYATNGCILVWIDLSLVDEAERMDEGIHFNSTLWTGDLDKTEWWKLPFAGWRNPAGASLNSCWKNPGKPITSHGNSALSICRC